MSHYYFTHQSDPTEKYLAVEDGTQVRVSWDESMGHSGRNSSGNNTYDAQQAANYLKSGIWVRVDEVIDVDTGRTTEELTEELGIFRPELTTRKVGKVRVELVDDGFTLALREVAKVMTWAQTAKGYKDHDWMNLPEAEIQLAAAASRHRTDHIVQRLIEDKPALECVDPESALMHKAHEAFGVLAQLEYMLRNKPE
jgi:hypothetical protein